ncbi:open rectifier potassium channel protein 1 isoform X2 [Coccinella septempunctata]|uniref:open rectifier potassium channel protein 1 isoform X2 n=1 Tax=Coccinella septempunctata TaxID=41139 RepID=UPI001D0848E5|nr:open rectifier potassium channel protein 1 isoform X2 [Coccinella septempunctata]
MGFLPFPFLRCDCGYGNLAPTTMFGRIFMIFYALVGIPINGFIMIALGDFFGKSFTKLYNRWKDSKRVRQVDPSRLGLVAQIILYLVPGFTFFIFVPSIVISAFEGWSYYEAVYFSFVTLTTIGFGDYVAGEAQGDLGYLYYNFYQVFLLVWIIGGLGYVVMILNFIGKGMRSKKLQELEHKIAYNIMKTPTRIRQELRSILAEFLMVRVKKVYKEFDYEPQKLVRSQSCPTLTVYSPSGYLNNLDRKRAFSECQDTFILQRIQSDTDLERIDKELTFQGTDQQTDLIIKVVDALSTHDYVDSEPGCYEGFSEREILASEQYDSEWSLASQRAALPPFRHRAASDVRYPSHPRLQNENEHTWYGQTYLARYAKLIKDDKSTSEPNNEVQKDVPGFFKRIKNTILSKDRNDDVEKGNEQSRPTQEDRNRELSLAENEHKQILEKTSVADLLRALTALSDSTSGSSQQDGNKRVRRMPIRSNFQNRRTSLMPNIQPATTNYKMNRRSSLIPISDYSRFSTSALPYPGPRRSSLAPVSELPPPYHQVTQQDAPLPLNPSKIRRFSVRPVANSNTSSQRFSKKGEEPS